jgi:hypothetical protein
MVPSFRLSHPDKYKKSSISLNITTEVDSKRITLSTPLYFKGFPNPVPSLSQGILFMPVRDSKPAHETLQLLSKINQPKKFKQFLFAWIF